MIKTISFRIKQEVLKISYLAGPIAVTQIGQYLINLTDSVMVARLGAIPLAASAFATSIFSLFLVFGAGLLSPISPLIAIAKARAHHRHGGQIFWNAMLIALLAGVAMALMMSLILPFLSSFGQSPDVVRLAGPYLFWIALSIVPALIFVALRQFCDGLGYLRIALFATLFGLVLNAGFNMLLIFGYGGLPALGLEGAGIASLIARVVMMLIMLLYVAYSSNFEIFLKRRFARLIRQNVIRRLLRHGSASGAQYLFEVAAFSFATVMVGWISAEALAAHQLVLSLASLTFMCALGTSFAVSIRVAESDHPRFSALVGVMMGGFIMAFFGGVFIVFRSSIAELYIADPKVIEVAAQLFLIAAAFQVFDGIQCVAVGALRGMLDTAIPTLLTCLAYWVIALPAAYLFGFVWHAGVNGIWWGLALGLAFSSIALTLRIMTRRISS